MRRGRPVSSSSAHPNRLVAGRGVAECRVPSSDGTASADGTKVLPPRTRGLCPDGPGVGKMGGDTEDRRKG